MKFNRIFGLLVPFALVAGICGCSNGYPAAVSAYAATSSESAGSFAALSSLAAGFCRDGSMARYLKLRLEGSEAPIPGWQEYYQSSSQVGGKLSWKDYCAEVEGTASGVSALIGSLRTYASVLSALATEEVWDGSSSRDASKGLAALSGARTPVGQALSTAAPSAEKLNGFFGARYDDLDTRQLAASSDIHVQAILDGLLEYISRIRTEILEPTRKDRLEIVRLLESQTNLWTKPLDAASIAGFVSHVRSVDDVRGVDSRLGDFATLIHEMKKAHTVLATKPADRRTADELTMAVANMMATLAQVEPAATIRLSSHGTNGS